MSDAATVEDVPDKGAGLAERALGFIERAGNRVPSPAILFIGLIVMVIALSQVRRARSRTVASPAGGR
jgi:aminobenzoyl-glutamate transport protein